MSALDVDGAGSALAVSGWARRPAAQRPERVPVPADQVAAAGTTLGAFARSALSPGAASGQAMVGADSSSSLVEDPSITNSAAPRNAFIASSSV
jgi:hypothetical protein